MDFTILQRSDETFKGFLNELLNEDTEATFHSVVFPHHGASHVTTALLKLWQTF